MYNDQLVRLLAEGHAADLLREADRRRLAVTARRAARDRLAAARTSLGRSARAGAASVRRARAW